jgi:DMSO/TMAO reductase YedYZ molybdopterin-dependent catalytic subunit
MLIKQTPFIEKKPSSLRYFQEGAEQIDIGRWSLDVSGEVKMPVSFSYAELRSIVKTYQHRRTVCVCLWSIKRPWEGVLLREILAIAGVDQED